MNDKVTILLAQKGDEAAFRKLFVEFRRQVFQWAFQYTNSIEDAEDILQETFIKAFHHLPSLQNIGMASFAQWLKQICIRTSLNHLRKMRRRRKDMTFSISELVIEPESGQKSSEDIVHVRHLYEHIQNALLKLSAKQRMIFKMRHSEDKNIKEISELMNCTESNVKAHLSRSMKQLKRHLASLREA
jgi:RNA polymerase sigma-70 factor (ECF subfamily)